MSKILLVYDDYNVLTSTETALKKVGFDVLGASNEFSLGERVLAFNPDLVIAFGKTAKVSTLGVGRKLKEMPRWQGKSILIMPQGTKPKPADLLKVRVDQILEAPISIPELVQALASFFSLDANVLLEKLNKGFADPAVSKQSGHLNDEDYSAKDQGIVRVGGADGTEAAIVVKGKEQGANKAITEVGVSGGKNEHLEKGNSGNSGGVDDDLSFTQESARRSLENARQAVSDRRQRYKAHLVMSEPALAQSKITRVEAKKRQKELQKELDMEMLEDQDKLRRSFTAALFKKR